MALHPHGISPPTYTPFTRETGMRRFTQEHRVYERSSEELVRSWRTHRHDSVGCPSHSSTAESCSVDKLCRMQFRYLFVRYGMVEHSTLLSQLDNLGKRRGFILMNTHQEAVRALGAMNGQWVE